MIETSRQAGYIGSLTAEQLDSLVGRRPTQYVSASMGNDDNPGSARHPVATIGQAVYNVEQGGRIVVLPGTYAEIVDIGFSPRLLAFLVGIELVVTPGATITAATSVVTLPDHGTITGGGRVTCTGASNVQAIKVLAGDHARISNLRVVSACRGINIQGSSHSIIRNVAIEAAEAGVISSICEGLVIEDCSIVCAGWTQCRSWGIAVQNSTTPEDYAVISRRNIIRVSVPVGEGGVPGKIPSALYADGSVIVDDGSYLYATSGNNKYAQTVCVLDSNSQISLCNSTVRAVGESDGGEDDAFDLFNGGGRLAVRGVDYVTSSGDITEL